MNVPHTHLFVNLVTMNIIIPSVSAERDCIDTTSSFGFCFDFAQFRNLISDSHCCVSIYAMNMLIPTYIAMNILMPSYLYIASVLITGKFYIEL